MGWEEAQGSHGGAPGACRLGDRPRRARRRRGGAAVHRKASACDPDPSQAFLPWGDTRTTRSSGGGTFERAAALDALRRRRDRHRQRAWLRRGRRRHALALTSRPAPRRPRRRCASRSATGTPASSSRNTGNTSGNLEVDIVVPSLLGLRQRPRRRLRQGRRHLGSVPARQRAALERRRPAADDEGGRFRLRAVGTGAAFQVDDVFLDPVQELVASPRTLPTACRRRCPSPSGPAARNG